MSVVKEQKTLLNAGWYHMNDAPKHKLIEVFCPTKDGVPGIFSIVRWDEYSGFTVHKILEPVMWRYI